MLYLSKKRDPKKIIKKESKAEDYLYKRWEGTEKNMREEENKVYEKRIKSYM